MTSPRRSASPRPGPTFNPPSVVLSARLSGTSVQKSGRTSSAIPNISAVAAISRLNAPRTV